ncbi:MAG: monovalent cation:proton antiporter family protein [Candidatus Promineifilaceae bacterium]
MEPTIFFSPVHASASGPTYLPSFIILLLAFSVPILLRKVNRRYYVPVVVLEIIIGVIAGQVDLAFFGGTLLNDTLLPILSEIGFGFLFFVAGMEINVAALAPDNTRGRTFKDRLASPLPLGTAIYLGTIVVGLILTFILFQIGILRAGNWGFMAVALAPSSLGIILSVLKEKGYASRHFGQILLVGATVADFGTVLLLTVLLTYFESGLDLRLLQISYIFIAFGVAYWVLNYLYSRPNAKGVLARVNTTTSPVKLRFAFMIFLAFIALSQAINAKIVLGTFMAGLLVKMLSDHDDEETLHELEAIGYGFFVPLFFIMIGVQLDLNALVNGFGDIALMIPALLVVAILVKVIPGLLLRLVLPMKETIAGGMLLTARLSLIVATAQSGFDAGIFSAIDEAAVILLAMLMATIGPLYFNRTMPKPDEDMPPPIIVLGATKLGLELATQLEGHGEPVVIVDDHAGRLKTATDAGFTVQQGVADEVDSRIEELLDSAEKIVSAYTDTDRNFRLCKFIKHHYGTPHVVAEVDTVAAISQFARHGIAATNPTVDRTALLTLLTRNPTSYELLTRIDDDREVHEVTVHNPAFFGKTLRQIHLPNSSNLIIIAVQRRHVLYLPNGDLRLEEDDVVTIAGPKGHGPQSFQIFSKEGLLD